VVLTSTGVLLGLWQVWISRDPVLSDFFWLILSSSSLSMQSSILYSWVFKLKRR
jgi:hypothetical protein